MMVDFPALFLASRGRPVEYEGNMIHLSDPFPVRSGANLRVIRESNKTGWRQGVHLATSGSFKVDGAIYKKAVVLWADTAPEIVILGMQSRDGICHVKNVWDTGDGTMHSWHNGAAMIIEETSTGRRYRCNDGHPDADFDDIVFRLELEGGVPE